MSVDPSDDCTFWYTGEYLTGNGTFNWHTRIGSFKFASCGSASIGAPTSVTTNGASRVTAGSATLNGSANPHELSTTAWVRYSTVNPVTCDNVFGTATSPTSSLGSGTSPQSYTFGLTGLAASTTYYCCAIANNTSGTTIASGAPVSFTTPSASAIAFVGERGLQVTGNTIKPASNTTQGDFLVLFLGSQSSVHFGTPTDTQGNTWHLDVELVSAQNNSFAIASVYLTHPLTTADTITVPGPSNDGALLEEFSGIAPSSPLDQAATNQSSGSTLLDSGTTAGTTQAKELVIAGWMDRTNSFSLSDVAAGYAIFPTDPVNSGSGTRSVAGLYQVVSSTGTQKATATSSVSVSWVGGIVTYKGQ